MMYKEYQIHKQILLPTPKDIEGPFYKPNAPFRNSLDLNSNLHLYGQVLDVNGNPIQAIIEFWQADASGEYDMEGYNYRCRVKTDTNGNYTLDTIEPGDYSIGLNEFRCAHIHVKVNVNNYTLLTTQLYFAGDKYNEIDHWFNPKMIIGKPNGKFDFILEKE